MTLDTHLDPPNYIEYKSKFEQCRLELHTYECGCCVLVDNMPKGDYKAYYKILEVIQTCKAIAEPF